MKKKTPFLSNTAITMWSLVRLFTIVMCVEYLFLQSIVCQDCQFEYMNGTEYSIDPYGNELTDKINDTEKPGKVLLSLRAKNVKDIMDPGTTSKDRYMNATLENATLILTLADSFVDYEENEFVPSISISVTFTCMTGSKKVEFIQPIEDTNNHKPDFEKAHYLYKLPMPFPKGVSLNYFEPISARDIDVSNRNITFNLDPGDLNASGFSISWLCIDTNDRKRYNATLTTKNVINFANDVNFTLYSTDTGTPPSSSSATVTIQVDRQNSILRFAKSLYVANLTNLKPEDANGKVITFVDGDEIGLRGGVDDNVTYEIQDDPTGYSENFGLTISPDHSKTLLWLKDPPEKFFLESSVLLVLTAEKLGQSQAKESTVVYIYLPGSDANGSTSNNMQYIVPIIVLSILLIAATCGLVVVVIKNHRNRKKSSIGKLPINGDQTSVPEMEEVIRNGSVSPNGSFGKSVAFNDTVEKINIAKL